MTEKTFITMPHSEPLYSQIGIVEAVCAAQFIFVSGQAGVDETFKVYPTFEEQSRATFANMKNVLAKAGADESHIVQIMAFIKGTGSAEEFAQRVMVAFGIAREVMPKLKTASTAVGVTDLAMPEMMIEVQAIAIKP